MRLIRLWPLIWLLWTTPIFAGVIRGTVRVPALGAEDHAFQPYAGKASSLPGHARPSRGRISDVVISIQSLPAEVAHALPEQRGSYQLAQRDQAFVPRVIACAVGSEVDFPNQDPIYHNVFSVSPPARFDLGKYPRGQSRRVRMAKPGLVKVFCDIHSDMAAFILVLPNRAFARPNEDGLFRLPELPAGRYVLKWWHPDFAGGSREVEVPASGDAYVDVTF